MMDYWELVLVLLVLAAGLLAVCGGLMVGWVVVAIVRYFYDR